MWLDIAVASPRPRPCFGAVVGSSAVGDLFVRHAQVDVLCRFGRRAHLVSRSRQLSREVRPSRHRCRRYRTAWISGETRSPLCRDIHLARGPLPRPPLRCLRIYLPPDSPTGRTYGRNAHSNPAPPRDILTKLPLSLTILYNQQSERQATKSCQLPLKFARLAHHLCESPRPGEAQRPPRAPPPATQRPAPPNSALVWCWFRKCFTLFSRRVFIRDLREQN